MHLRKTLLILFLVLIALYTIFQARLLIMGPKIEVLTPTPGETLNSQVVTVSGLGENLAYLSLNGRQIFTDEKGFWQEKLIAPVGPSIMTLVGKDRFGRETKKQLEIVVN